MGKFFKVASNLTWLEDQAVMNRAMRGSEKGVGKAVVDKELLKKRLKVGLPANLAGSVIGGALGYKALKGPGAFVGALSTGLTAQLMAQGEVDQRYLKDRGIDANWWTGRIKSMTPAARRKYVSKAHGGGWSSQRQVKKASLKQLDEINNSLKHAKSLLSNLPNKSDRKVIQKINDDIMSLERQKEGLVYMSNGANKARQEIINKMNKMKGK